MSDTPLRPLPEKFEIINGVDSITIRRKWFTPVAFFLLFFSLFWNGFMVVWMTMAFKEGQTMMAGFGSLHAIVGIVLMYYTLCLFINKSDVTVNSVFLAVNHHPLPWLGKKKIPVHTITQLFCEEKIRRHKNGTSVTYQVHVATSDGRRKKLVSGLPKKNQARFIEQEIETTLGLKNKPVSGEI